MVHSANFIALFVVMCMSLFRMQAQTDIGGVINIYARVQNITFGLGTGTDNCNNTVLQLNSAAGFATGDLVLLIQMKGAAPNTGNNDNFGSVGTGGNSFLGNVGNFEFSTVHSVAGNDLRLASPPQNTYDVAGSVQLVRVPNIAAPGANVTAQLAAAPWDDAAGTGGVLALVVDGVLTFAPGTGATATGRGFVGGQAYTTAFNTCNQGNRAYSNAQDNGANKGQGGVIGSVIYTRGRGAWLNGGGGGNARSGGGGGGANGGAGGLGGGGYFAGCGGGNTQGRGGFAVAGGNTRAILGGGGGAGHRNGGTGASGGTGGGVIMILANQIVGNNTTIQANGTAGQAHSASNGAGGGGAGGSILLQTADFGATNLTTNANGANGGNVTSGTNNCPGPGGGGGGGVIRTSMVPPATVTRTVNLGNAGVRSVPASCANLLATNGAAGTLATNLSLALPAPCVPSVQELATLCLGSLGGNGFPDGDFGTITGVDETVATSASWTTPTPVTFKNASAAAPGYTYLPAPGDGQPQDGFYTIATGIRNPYGTAGGEPFWITSNDNSGGDDGFCMVVNADFEPGVIYSADVTGICENTKYEFRADIINLYTSHWASESNPTGGTQGWFPSCNPVLEPGCRQMVYARTRGCEPGGDCFNYSILPDVDFLIDGGVVTTSGPVPNNNNWISYGLTFNTLPGVTSFTLSLRNKAPGGIGNDLALDNISFRACGPSLTMDANTTICEQREFSSSIGPDFDTPNYVWEYSTDAGATWTEFGTNQSSAIPPDGLPVDAQFRVSAANSADNLTNPLCVVSSEPYAVDCVLPLREGSFVGTHLCDKVRLEWGVSGTLAATEYFVVEASAEGRNYYPIASRPQQLAGRPSYVCEDDAHDLATSARYYRLILAGENGSQTVLAQRYVQPQGCGEHAVQLRYLPASQQVHAYAPELLPASGILKLWDPAGRLVRTAQVRHGQATLTLPTTRLAAGIYVAHWQAGTRAVVKKIIVE